MKTIKATAIVLVDDKGSYVCLGIPSVDSHDVREWATDMAMENDIGEWRELLLEFDIPMPDDPEIIKGRVS